MQFPSPLSLADLYGQPGLKMVGGQLHADHLLAAYNAGFFPWSTDNEPLMWYAPDPRFVLFPKQLRLNKSARNAQRKSTYEFRLNHDMELVLRHCANVPRAGQDGTWLFPALQQCILELYEKGRALCYAAYRDNKLVGGLYGMIAGTSQKVFCGESMFSFESNASKLCFIDFVQHYAAERFSLIDCQQETSHMRAFGARLIPVEDYLAFLG